MRRQVCWVMRMLIGLPSLGAQTGWVQFGKALPTVLAFISNAFHQY